MPDANSGTPLHARPQRFDFSNTPLQWIPGAPYASHVISVLHLIAPVGEKRFIRAMQEALPRVTDPALRAEVKGFIAQEATHAHVHEAVLAHLKRQGVDAEDYLRAYERVYDWVAGDRPFIPVPADWWTHWKLAYTAAAEQVTCVLGNWALDAHALDAHGADPVMLNFLRWHGAEEVEHRSVAFDVLKHLAGPMEYPYRVAAMASLFPVLVGLWQAGTAYLIARDPQLAGRHFSFLDFVRAVEDGLLPGVELLTACARFVAPDFHPSQEGRPELAAAFFAGMAGPPAAAA